ncbi:MAG: hypothetical protein JWN75_1119, partial [Candidatus Saccharibacteria bacterium]|nr:hypothetical protein [Candidatus Saccharibacteria bacterium]
RALAEAGEERALTLRASKGIEIKGNTKELAKGEADYRVYQQDTDLPGQGPLLNAVDSVTNSIMDLRRTQVWAKFVFPFVKTPTNILKQGIEFSPLGAVNAIGAEDKITAITRAAIGTAVFGASWAMVANGDATWGEPRNPEEKARFKAEGKQPYSFKIGDKWVNFSKLPPAVSFPFALTAGIDDAIKNKKMDENQAKAIFTGIAKYGEFLGDQSYLKNIGDTLGAFEGDPDKAVQAFANYPQQVVPLRALTGWLARMTDDKERKINNDAGFIDKQVQSLIMNYPGLRQKVGTRDYRGEPIPANNPVLNSFSPFKITDDRGTNPLDSIKDQAKQESQKLPELTTAQTKEYKSLAASQVDKAQNTLSRSREFQSLNTVDKAKALESVKTKINSAYKRTYMQERDIPLTKQPSKSDVKIISGKSAPSDYISKGSRGGSSTSIAPNITPHSKKVLDEYSTLDTATRNKKLASEPDYEWKVAKSKYENDKASGKISSVQDIDRQKKLAKLEIGKPYSKEARDLFGKSKADVYEYITNAKNGEQLASEIKAYDQALFEAGLVKYATFQKSIAPAKGGGGRKTTKGGAKYTSKSGTGSKKSGGKGKTAKGSTKGTIKDFSELYAFAQPKTTTSSLRKLLADAKVTKR